MSELRLSRRSVLAGTVGFAALGLAGCALTPRRGRIAVVDAPAPIDPYYLALYAAMPDEQFPVPRAEIEVIDPKFWRHVVADPTGERAGTLVIDTGQRFLYLSLGDGQALRYGVGVGREGFAWSGRGYIGRKKEWPTWTPPTQMIERQPELEPYRDGMPPGYANPLGARALYIYQDGRDTLYRLHGNNDPRAIGQAVSSGCIRLLDQDVIDLYQRVPVETDVLVA